MNNNTNNKFCDGSKNKNAIKYGDNYNNSNKTLFCFSLI